MKVATVRALLVVGFLILFSSSSGARLQPTRSWRSCVSGFAPLAAAHLHGKGYASQLASITVRTSCQPCYRTGEGRPVSSEVPHKG